MKKIIVICSVLFVVGIFGAAAVFLPMVAKMKKAALKVAAEKERKVAEWEIPLDDEPIGEAEQAAERKAIAALQKFGSMGRGMDINDNVADLEISGSRITDAGLVHLKDLIKLRHLNLSDTQVTDAGLVHLKDLTKLRHLNLSDTQVTDAGVADLQKALPACEITHGEQTPLSPPVPAPEKEKLVWVSDPDNPQNVFVEQKLRNKINKSTGELSGADLEKVEHLVFVLKLNDEGLKEVAKLKRLKSLLLVKTNITDAGLREMAKLPELVSLTISGADITNVGLKELVNVPNLVSLGLPATQVTDEGLKELAKLKNLFELNLGGTRVSKAGVAALRKALPQCSIKH